MGYSHSAQSLYDFFNARIHEECEDDGSFPNFDRHFTKSESPGARAFQTIQSDEPMANDVR